MTAKLAIDQSSVDLNTTGERPKFSEKAKSGILRKLFWPSPALFQSQKSQADFGQRSSARFGRPSLHFHTKKDNINIACWKVAIWDADYITFSRSPFFIKPRQSR